ncbi:MAG: S-ribosylhomocysteine lyase [Clostridia bacterium]|nr:S-ribosylhomocysteine lyase [Clostridia bacterium]
MKKIASFTINHDTLTKGMYVSRIDGDVVTYDIRMKLPNGGEYLSTAAAHTFEHLFATFARNSEHGGKILYVGPMGCRTGFYLLTRDTLTAEQAIALTRESMRFIRDYDGEIPGNKKEECGNYLDHDLAGAKALGAEMYAVLENWTTKDLQYKE